MPYLRTYFSAAIFFACLLGCGRSQSQSQNASTPWAADLAAAKAPDYRAPPATIQECIGRLSFNVDHPVQWPTYYHPQMTEHWGATFSLHVYEGDSMVLGEDSAGFGKVRTAVFDSTSEESAKEIRRDLPAITLDFYKERIQMAKDTLAELRRKPATSKTPWMISLQEDRIKDFEKALAQTKSTQFVFAADIENVEGYGTIEAAEREGEASYSRMKAYLTQGGHIYAMESTRQLTKDLTKESHATAFAALIKSFKPRKPGEIPMGHGICVPFGFFPDEGHVKSDIKQSFRFKDAPNVLHTIRTGSYSNYRGNPPAMRAATLAATGKFGSDAEESLKPYVTRRIGPRSVKLGALAATQGGFAAKIAPLGEQPFEAYSLLTGYGGWKDSDELPFIVVEMNSKSAKAAPELKGNPPPFEVSMARHEAVLRSIRLRHMPK